MFPDPLGAFLANGYFAATAGSNPNASLAEFNAILGSQSGSFGINQFYTNLGAWLASGGLLGGGSSLPVQYTNLDEQIPGSAGNDIIFAEGGNDVVDGWLGNDYLAGGAGNDWLFGNVGDDYLIGRTGTDVLFGGVGSDFLMGGTDIDYFAYTSPLEGADLIIDFNWNPEFGFIPQGGDKIAISSSGFGITPDQVNFFSYQYIGTNSFGDFGGLFFGQTMLAAIPFASGFNPQTDIVFF